MHPNPIGRRPVNHAAIARRIDTLREALSVLTRHGLDILDVDLNRSTPVILIPPRRHNAVLGGAVPYSHSHDPRGRVLRYQVMVAGCRVEWEIVGH